MSIFQELNPKLTKALDKLSITEPTDIQQEAIPTVLDGLDVMDSVETGSGKTAAFVLPIL